MVPNICRILLSRRWNVSNFPKMYISLKSNCLSEGVCSSFSLVLWKYRWYSWRMHFQSAHPEIHSIYKNSMTFFYFSSKASSKCSIKDSHFCIKEKSTRHIDCNSKCTAKLLNAKKKPSRTWLRWMADLILSATICWGWSQIEFEPLFVM